jgi:hypothetical protein
VVDRRLEDRQAELVAAGSVPFYEAFRLIAYGPCGAHRDPETGAGAVAGTGR